MAGEEVELSSQPPSNGTLAGTKRMIDIVHFHSSWVLFIIFLTAFIANSILTAKPPSESQEPLLTGPGGKPLPRSARKYKEELQRRKKLKDFSPGRKSLFLYLSAGLLSTFVASGTNVVVHALYEHAVYGDNSWWCGEATAVSWALQ